MDLLRPSTSRNIPTFQNFYISELELHDLAGMEGIVSKNIKVKEFNGEPVNIRTHFINFKERKQKPIFVFKQ